MSGSPRHDAASANALGQWLAASDSDLERLCHIEPYQASGPGGQKRNRKYSAVRLVHAPTGIAVTASESRSQADNRRTALRKLRRTLAMRIESDTPIVCGRAEVGMGNPAYPLWLAWVVQHLRRHNFALAETAVALGCSTGRLSRLLHKDPELWGAVNAERRSRGLPELKGS